MKEDLDSELKDAVEKPIVNNKGFYLEDGGDFCRGCGWNRAGDCHDLVGRLFYFDPCPKCGRTEGKPDA